jgi:hypothetical protein
MNYKASQTIFEKPERIFEGKRLLPIWDIRVERNRADEFFARCLAEAIGRGLMTVNSPDTEKWASEVNETMRQAHVRDFLAGAQTVSELDDFSLMYLTTLSFHRQQCLQHLMNIQDGKDEWTKWESLCFPKLAPEAESDTVSNDAASAIIL